MTLLKLAWCSIVGHRWARTPQWYALLCPRCRCWWPGAREGEVYW